MNIVALVPAHNEHATIAATIRALLRQSRNPDRIVVVADNCTDHTARIAGRYDGITVYETVDNRHGKSGALNQAWCLFCTDADLVVCVDADTLLAENAVADWEKDMRCDPGLGGSSAKFTMVVKEGMTGWERLLVRLQRAEFSKWTDSSLRRGYTSVLAGTSCCLRNQALKGVVRAYRGAAAGPWTDDSLVEDFELTFRVRQLGWTCKVGRTVRAYTDAMTTLRSLWAQRMKWQSGTVQDLLSFGLSRLTLLDWWQQFQGLLAALLRTAWIALVLVGALTHSLVLHPVWLVPPLIFVANDVRQALRIPHPRPADLTVAALLVPQELFAWMRSGWFVASWIEVLCGRRRDRWVIQREMELSRRFTG